MSTDHERRERIDAVADAEGTEDDLLTVAVPPDGSVGEVLERVEEALEYEAVETTLISGDRPVEELREFEERTAEEGGEVVVVPPETEAGARFDETFGVAAMLRFPIE